LATGLSIAAYTVVDGLGVRASGSSLSYIAWLMAVEGVAVPAYALYRWRGDLLTVLRPFAAVGLLGAALSVAAYGLVLWAQTKAELAPIAALRESSIIVGAAIGAVFFKERFGAPRIAAAGLLVVGIGLMLHAA
jgi:drug/metabolite transporter (DMT)-like permease